jgi:hypothetical protein
MYKYIYIYVYIYILIYIYIYICEYIHIYLLFIYLGKLIQLDGDHWRVSVNTVSMTMDLNFVNEITLNLNYDIKK